MAKKKGDKLRGEKSKSASSFGSIKRVDRSISEQAKPVSKTLIGSTAAAVLMKFSKAFAAITT